MCLAQNDVVTKIVAKGDILDGKEGSQVFLGDDDSLEGNQVIVRVDFTGGGQGLYRAFVE